MDISLKQILTLVCHLEDAPGEHTARERFRQFLRQSTSCRNQPFFFAALGGGGK